MRFLIDTNQKTIQIKEECKLPDLIEELKSLLGKDWKEYKIEVYTPYWTQPWIYPTVTYYDNSDYKPPYTITCSGQNIN
jgi:hypothetical protein